MALVQIINQSYLWDDVIWEAGSVLEVDDYVATYQIACGRMALPPPEAKRTPKPPMMEVTPRHTPQATGEAIATALVNKLGVAAKPKPAREDEDTEKSGRGAKKHEF